jgi:hypothetical protein
MTRIYAEFLFAILMLATMAMPALARGQKSFDVCVNPATDLATQDDATKPGAFVTVAANIYPGGTIPMGEQARAPALPPRRSEPSMPMQASNWACPQRRTFKPL